jgi:hypothetical protein
MAHTRSAPQCIDCNSGKPAAVSAGEPTACRRTRGLQGADELSNEPHAFDQLYAYAGQLACMGSSL